MRQRDTTQAHGMSIYWQRDYAPLREPKFFGYTSRVTLEGEDVRLLVPTTFMNLSGKAVGAMASFYRINPDEILVAHDELDLLLAWPNLSLAAVMADIMA
jgi:PTH1 family peptidyl-tRNA hydrolase